MIGHLRYATALATFCLAAPLVVPLASFAYADDPADCEGGFEAFQKTVYPKIIKDCHRCHDGSQLTAPAFAVPDKLMSYYALINRVNFSDPAHSILAIRAGNNHCNSVECQSQSGQEMLTLIESWYAQGENLCHRDGRFFTAELELPQILPGPPLQGQEGEFAQLTFDLAEISVQFAGAKLTLDVQRFSNASGATPGSLRFRKPRLITAGKSLRLGSARVLLDRQFSPLATGYTLLDRILAENEQTLLSTHALIILEHSDGPPKRASVSFEVIETAPVPACASMNEFKKYVLPVLAEESCYKCHGGGPQNSAGTEPARKMFSMARSESGLCSAIMQRVDRTDSDRGPFFAFPLTGLYGHPIVQKTSVNNVYFDWCRWLDEELNGGRIF